MLDQAQPTKAPSDLYAAEPIPAAVRDEIERLLSSGDLFRYTSQNVPVTLLEREFAAQLGSTYALAGSSCSAALFLSLKALDLPRDARVIIPAFTFAAVPSSVVHAECVPVLCEVGENYRIDLNDFADKLEQDISAVIIMSGACEHAWEKHGIAAEAVEKWQNKLPLYNFRLSNMSAAIVRAQLPEIARRVADGRRNHDRLAAQLNRQPNVTVPEKLAPENRAPDRIQFNLTNMTDAAVTDFVRRADAQGIKVQVFGMSADNARAFWNWQFLNDIPELPKTRAMLMRACDVGLPARLTPQDCDMIGEILLNSLPSGELN